MYALTTHAARDGGANDPVKYTIDWGDGTSPTTCQGSADGTSVPVQDHQYNEEGLRLVTVTPSYGSIQYTYVGTADASPTIAIPPEQAVAAGQSLSVSSSFTGGAADDQWVSFIDLGDGTGKHAGSVGSGGSLSFNVAAPTTPGVYHPVITLYDKGGTAEATATYIMDVWGVALDQGESNDVLMASSDGTQNLQPVTFYFPHPDGVALNLTLSTSDATDVDMWPTNSPNPGDTPLLGGSTSSMSLSVPASQTSQEYWVGAINGNTTLNVLQYTLAGAVNGSPSLPPGTQPVPVSQPIKSNPGSNLKVMILSLNNPNGGASGNDVTDAAPPRPWLVGQFADLLAQIVGPPNLAPKPKYNWKIPGLVLRRYTPSPAHTTVLAVRPSDPFDEVGGVTVAASPVGTAMREVQFFWVTVPSNPATVSVTINLGAQGVHTAKTQFQVYAPAVNPVILPVGQTPGTHLPGGMPWITKINNEDIMQVHDASQPGTPAGFSALANVQQPANAGFAQGSWTFLQQTLSYDRVEKWTHSGTDSFDLTTDYVYVLDYDPKNAGVPLAWAVANSNLYNGVGAPASNQIPTGTANMGMTDVPTRFLSTQYSVLYHGAKSQASISIDESVNDDVFQTYIMYLPPGSQSQWVPLQQVSWSFRADAKKVNNAWTLVSKSPATAANFVNSSAEPIWHDFFQNGEWQQR